MLFTTEYVEIWETDSVSWTADCLVHYSLVCDDAESLADVDVHEIEVLRLQVNDNHDGFEITPGAMVQQAVLELASEYIYWRHLCDTAVLDRFCLEKHQEATAEEFCDGDDD